MEELTLEAVQLKIKEAGEALKTKATDAEAKAQKALDSFNELKEKVALEKGEYLSQFPESERGSKLAEMKLANIKLPLQLELEKRFRTGVNFYADYVQQRVKRESFATEEEYQKALQDEAWKVGYAFGYLGGSAGRWYEIALRSLQG